MRSFKKQRGFKDILHSRPVLGFLGILVLIFSYGVIRFMDKTEMTRENREMVESKVTELRKEKEQLTRDIARLQTAGGIEESIRDKFGLAKEGEGVIVVVDDKNKVKEQEEEPGGFFSFFKNWFK